MPKRIVTVKHQCVICDRQYPRLADAEECERHGVAPYQFVAGQVVEYKPFGDVVSKVIINEADFEITDSPHVAPKKWSVLIDRFDPKELATESLKPIKYRLAKCPLCNSQSISAKHSFVRHNLSAIEFKNLNGVEVTYCKACNVEYLTQPQLERMLAHSKARADEIANAAVI